jgi:hypothetical protein
VNTYRVVSVSSDRWAVEWSSNGTPMGLVPGTFDTEAETQFAAYELAKMEALERPGL